MTTDVYGRFALGGIIPETETLLVIQKEGFTPSLRPVVAPRWSSEIGLSYLFRPETVFYDRWNAVLHAAGRRELDASDEAQRAAILFSAEASSGALTNRLHVGLEPRSDEVPLFVLFSGDWVLEVPAGQVAAAGIYLDLEPRDDGYELVYEPADGECRQTPNAVGGWPSASGRLNATRVPARAGYTTWLSSERCKFADAARPATLGKTKVLVTTRSAAPHLYCGMRGWHGSSRSRRRRRQKTDKKGEPMGRLIVNASLLNGDAVEPFARNMTLTFVISVTDEAGAPIAELDESQFQIVVATPLGVIAPGLEYTKVVQVLDAQGDPVQTYELNPYQGGILSVVATPVTALVPGPAPTFGLPGFYRIKLRMPPNKLWDGGRMAAEIVVTSGADAGQTLVPFAVRNP